MSKKIYDAHNYKDILPYLANHIEKKEINISNFCEKYDFNRKTFYNNLYGEKVNIEFVFKLCNALGIKLCFGLATKK